METKMEYKRTIKLMVVGETGSGKTHLASTFPKSFFIITEPGGAETWLTKPGLRKNIVDFKEFIPESESDTARIFKELDAIMVDLRKRTKEGEIETVVLDNATYLAENRWMYINKHEQQIARNGEVDVRGMYGALSRWQYAWYLTRLLSLPSNIVITVHQKLESDEAMAKKPDKHNPVVPSILGGFRDDMPGMLSCVFYIWKEKIQGGYKYYARTDMGQGKMAKNRYGLKEVIENVDYNTIKQAIQATEVSQ